MYKKQENTHFENQVAIVTGAGVGIGFEIARQLAANGAKVILNDKHYYLALCEYHAKVWDRDIFSILDNPSCSSVIPVVSPIRYKGYAKNLRQTITQIDELVAKLIALIPDTPVEESFSTEEEDIDDQSPFEDTEKEEDEW